MSAPIAIRGCAKCTAAKTGSAKANATTAVHGSASNVLGSQSAATKTGSTKATAAETTTGTSSVETAPTGVAAAARKSTTTTTPAVAGRPCHGATGHGWDANY